MDLHEVTAILSRTPKVLETLLAGLPESWLHRNDGPGTWSAYDIAGHLAHGDDVNWLPRARMILAQGAEQPFPAFDREAMLREERTGIDVLLGRFAGARSASLAALASLNLTGSDLARTGSHPEFGEVALGQLLAAWVAHDLTHIAQVSEVLARNYRDAVGPWRVYMPALSGSVPAE